MSNISCEHNKEILVSSLQKKGSPTPKRSLQVAQSLGLPCSCCLTTTFFWRPGRRTPWVPPTIFTPPPKPDGRAPEPAAPAVLLEAGLWREVVLAFFPRPTLGGKEASVGPPKPAPAKL